MFEDLRRLSQHFLRIKNSSYRRYLMQPNHLTHRLSIIVGQRGVGKTTTLVQTLLDKTQGDRFDKSILYVQADHFQVGNFTMYEIAEQFHAYGGKWIALDEIHKYGDWSKELKSIYDTFPDLTIYASGSSALEIYRGSHDMTRRAVLTRMHGLSFREYLELVHHLDLPALTLENILQNHQKFSESIVEKLKNREKKVLPEFQEYIKSGYYPYFNEVGNSSVYKITLEQNLHTTIESDLTAIYPKLTGMSVKKIKQLLIYIAGSVPFTPNWTKVQTALDIGDLRTLKNYFKHLEDAHLIKSLHRATGKFSQVESPEKVFLDNTNQILAISSNPEKGTLRETFFLNALSQNYRVAAPKNGDFLIEGKYLFEVGGKKKSFHQIKDEKNSYLACDDIEEGAGKKIPLWLFGFLY